MYAKRLHALYTAGTNLRQEFSMPFMREYFRNRQVCESENVSDLRKLPKNKESRIANFIRAIGRLTCNHPKELGITKVDGRQMYIECLKCGRESEGISLPPIRYK